MIAVRPPDYFPRPAFFALMARVDRFVLADTFQYSRQSYQNRARLRTPQGAQWITVPLKARQHGTPIHAVRIRPVRDWQGTHARAFQYNYSSTPFYPHYAADFAPLFETTWAHLGDLTCATVEVLHRLLGLTTPLVRASALPGAPATLAALLDATGDADLLSLPDAAPYDARTVPQVRVCEAESPTYRQNFDGFVPGCSVVDLLFNYGPAALGHLMV